MEVYLSPKHVFHTTPPKDSNWNCSENLQVNVNDKVVPLMPLPLRQKNAQVHFCHTYLNNKQRKKNPHPRVFAVPNIHLGTTCRLTHVFFFLLLSSLRLHFVLVLLNNLMDDKLGSGSCCTCERRNLISFNNSSTGSYFPMNTI